MHALLKLKVSLIFLALIFLSACGGGSNSIIPTQVLESRVEQGGFQSISNAVYSQKPSIQATIDSVSGLDITAIYNVNAYKLEYWTLDSNNELIKVSGLLAVPEKSTASPLFSFQHGTKYLNAEAPSFNLSPTTDNPEIITASLGYIVFSADYIGYGSSFGKPHPYLLKQPSADIVVDMLRAGRNWLDFNNIQTTGELFMTGYSQGGYVTMAAAQHLQANPGLDFEVTAAVYGAGPYDIFATLDELVDKYLLGINIPDFLADTAIDILEKLALEDKGDINFDITVFERYLAGDRQDNVHLWRPDIPVKLFHGQGDETVPIEAAYSAQAAMTALGADVELVLCTAIPSDHKPCVTPYINYLVNYFEGLRAVN